MSVLFHEGFELETKTSLLDKYHFPSGGLVTYQATGGRRGTAGLKIDSFAESLQVGVTGQTELILGVAIDVPAGRSARSEALQIVDVSNIHATLTVESDGSVAVRLGGGTGAIQAQSAAGVVNDNVYNFFEWQMNQLGTGAVSTSIVRVNDVVVINATNIDIATLVVGILSVRFGGTTGSLPGWIIDDLYILDPNVGAAPTIMFLGSGSQTDTVTMSTDGATSDFTPAGAGSTHADRVDEDVEDGDTTRLDSTGLGDIDLFNPAALPVIAGGYVVGALKVEAAARRLLSQDGGLRYVFRPLTTNFFSEKYGVPFDYARLIEDLTEINPETGVRWTELDLTGLEVGVQHFNV